MRRSTDSEVRFYEFAGAGSPFRRVGTTYKCPSIAWTSRYSEKGSFSIQLPSGEEVGTALRPGVFVEIGRRFYGIIEEVSRTADTSGSIITASGPDVLGLLEQRITVPPEAPGGTAMMGYDAVRGSSETIIKHFVSVNAAAPFGSSRGLPLTVAPDKKLGVPDDKYMTRHDNLLEVVSLIAKDAQIGLSLTPDFDAGMFVFDCYAGRERLVTLSTERGTALSMNSMDSIAGYKNAFYATMNGAEFEDEALTMAYFRAAEPSGPGRREVHMSISAEHPTAGEEYNELRRLAMVNARNYEALLNLTCEINPAREALGEDYNLGDILTVQNREWGLTRPARVVAVTAEHSGNESKITAQFGDEKPSLIQRIRGRK